MLKRQEAAKQEEEAWAHGWALGAGKQLPKTWVRAIWCKVVVPGFHTF